MSDGEGWPGLHRRALDCFDGGPVQARRAVFKDPTLTVKGQATFKTI